MDLNFGAKIKNIIIYLSVLFLLWFPKGGIKIGGIPLTWGYLILGLLSVFSIIKILVKQQQLYLSSTQVYGFIAWLPFQIIVAIHILVNGFTTLPFLISLFVSFYFLPFFFIILNGHFFNKVDYIIIQKLIKKGVFFVAFYGIILFLYKSFTGLFIEIPYLTVNVDDIGTLEDKMIKRGDFFKLISTYNNGNIYGVCILMFMPYYDCIEKSKIKKIIVTLSLFLTLSRTVWIGLILYVIYKFSKVKLSTMLYSITFTLLFLIFVYISFFYIFEFDIEFLFDSDLGGRSEQLNIINNIEIFGKNPFSGISEIVYLSILDSFGFIGLIAFLFGLFSVIIFISLNYRNTPKLKKALIFGLIIYTVLCASDGAILLIPTMCFFWFITTVVVSKNRFFYEEKRKN